MGWGKYSVCKCVSKKAKLQDKGANVLFSKVFKMTLFIFQNDVKNEVWLKLKINFLMHLLVNFKE